MVYAESAGWRNFACFEENAINRSRTRVLSFLNIVGRGMAGGGLEQDVAGMDPTATAVTALKHPSIVGIKTAHYQGRDWAAVEHSLQAGDRAGLPAMVDFGASHPEAPWNDC